MLRLEELLDIKVPYRYHLRFPKEYTFGLELEFEGLVDERQATLLQLDFDEHLAPKNWHAGTDSSLVDGIEWQSPPLTFDQKDAWVQVKTAYDILDQRNLKVSKRCAGHIHLGAHILKENKLACRNMLMLWAVYEEEILRFFAGDYQALSQHLYDRARQCRDEIKQILDLDTKVPFVHAADLLWEFYHTKEKAIDFGHVTGEDQEIGNTIEFRAINGTEDPVIAQNNLNFIFHLCSYALCKDFDIERVNTSFQALERVAQYSHYPLPKIHLKKAEELAIMLFPQEEDRFYFLRQYVKDGKEESAYQKVKCFTK